MVIISDSRWSRKGAPVPINTESVAAVAGAAAVPAADVACRLSVVDGGEDDFCGEARGSRSGQLHACMR